MSLSPFYIAISIVALAIVALFVFLSKTEKGEKRISMTAGIAFAFVIGGIMFGENRNIGYTLLIIGILIAIYDMIEKARNK